MKRFIGVDLHKNQFTVCYLDETENKIIKQFKMSSLHLFQQSLNPEDEVAVEALANSRFFCEQIVQFVSDVVLVSPGNFKPISSSCKKTDKYDAETLAFWLKTGQLPPARMMNKKQAAIKSLVNTRSLLVKQRTQCKNKLLNILNSIGHEAQSEKIFTKKGTAELKSVPFDSTIKLEIDLLLKQIDNLNEAVSDCDKELAKPENQLPGFQNLISIKGIGPVSAAVFTSAIGDIKDFVEAKKLSAYFGMVPIVRCSNETVHYGCITKHGSRLVRSALVQCTLIAVRYNPILREFYQRIKQKKGSGKAIIATARKLLEFIHYTLSNDIIWEDSDNGIIKSSNMAA